MKTYHRFEAYNYLLSDTMRNISSYNVDGLSVVYCNFGGGMLGLNQAQHDSQLRTKGTLCADMVHVMIDKSAS